MWGYPRPVIGAVDPFLEPFRGRLSPNIDNVSEKLTLRYPHEGPWVDQVCRVRGVVLSVALCISLSLTHTHAHIGIGRGNECCFALYLAVSHMHTHIDSRTDSGNVYLAISHTHTCEPSEIYIARSSEFPDSRNRVESGEATPDRLLDQQTYLT